jgi:hypothetical protein
MKGLPEKGLIAINNYLILATSRISMSIYAQCSTTGNQEKANLKQKILRFRGKEYLEQNFIVAFECNVCGTSYLSTPVRLTK